MKKVQIFQYVNIAPHDREEALRVVAHACFQQSRGRRPSESYKGERNPRTALTMARSDLRVYDALPGDLIPRCIEHMARIARLANQATTAELNGITIIAEPDTPPSTLVKQWEDEIDRRAEEYLYSPEYKEYLVERAAEVAALKAKAEEMMTRLDSLDFDDIEAVVSWFEEIQEASDEIDIRDSLKDIVRRFEERGYVVNANCHDRFDASDKDNFGRWIVGQALYMLNCGYGVQHVIIRWAQEWRIMHCTPSPSDSIN